MVKALNQIAIDKPVNTARRRNTGNRRIKNDGIPPKNIINMINRITEIPKSTKPTNTFERGRIRRGK